MKKHFLTTILLSSLFFTACDSNDTVGETVYKDEDRVLTQLDQNNTVVTGLYNDFHMGLLYTYDNIKDFSYTAASATQVNAWATIEIPTIASTYTDATGNIPETSQAAFEQNVSENIDFINNNLFKYFKAGSKIASLMPYKVLLASSIYAPKGITVDSYYYLESESRIKSTSTVGDRRSVFNAHSIIFSADDDLKSFVPLSASRAAGSDYTRDNFYILLCKIFKMHNLADQLPASFFAGKTDYYGKLMSTVYGSEMAYTDTQISNLVVIDKEWFYSKGFIDGYYFFSTSGLPSSVTQTKDINGNTISPYIVHTLPLRPTYSFVEDKFEDVRAYISEMMHRNKDQFAAYPVNIRENIVILRDLLTSWGVDILAINPALATVTAN